MAHNTSVQDSLLFSESIVADDGSLLRKDFVRIFDVHNSQPVKLLIKLMAVIIQVDYFDGEYDLNKYKVFIKPSPNLDIHPRQYL